MQSTPSLSSKKRVARVNYGVDKRSTFADGHGQDASPVLVQCVWSVIRSGHVFIQCRKKIDIEYSGRLWAQNEQFMVKEVVPGRGPAAGGASRSMRLGAGHAESPMA